jgi:hypothetical protein
MKEQKLERNKREERKRRQMKQSNQRVVKTIRGRQTDSGQKGQNIHVCTYVAKETLLVVRLLNHDRGSNILVRSTVVDAAVPSIATILAPQRWFGSGYELVRGKMSASCCSTGSGQTGDPKENEGTGDKGVSRR